MKHTTHHNLLLDLDEATWRRQLDAIEPWLAHVLMSQTTFRKLAEDTHEKIHEPNVRGYLREVIEAAREHERAAEDLVRLIGHEPSVAGKVGGTVLAKARQAVADVVGLAGGAVGGWRDLHQLLLASLNATGAFGVAHQLGLALGHRELTEATLAVLDRKYPHHFMLQELVLELAPLSILYKREV